MKRNIQLLFLFLFVLRTALAQFSVEGNIQQLEIDDDTLSIEEAVQLYELGKFNKDFDIETYKFLKGKNAGWLVFNIQKLDQRNFISIENSLFEELEFYSYDGTTIHQLKDLRKEKEYRFPIIEVLPANTPSKLFVRFKDKLSYRTEFNIYTYTDTSFAKQQQKDYFFIGGYALSLFVLLISAAILFLYKRVYPILWYAIHLFLLIVEYLISTGIFSQWVLADEWIMKFGLDHVFMLLSTMALSEFFRNYYNYTKKTKFCKWIYLAISTACFLGAIYAIFDGYMGNVYNVEFYAQSVLNYASLLSLAIHCILVIAGVIPVYLFVAFLLPVLGIFANTGDFKNSFDNESITYFLFQSVYLGILIEVIVIIFYIMKQSIDKEFEAISLEEENTKLKNEFHEELSINQEEQQNAIVSDVHDSFGGYLEALKLRLITKDILTPDVESILDAFRKDYRFLLNSLYVPNIDSENFLHSIEDYCERMNSVTSIDIKLLKTGVLESGIPQNIAKYIFKASSELTTNALKYSKATEVIVKLDCQSDILTLEVIDDGIGFNKEKIKTSSFGLRGLEERAELLEGEFELNTTEGKGTRVRVKLSF